MAEQFLEEIYKEAKLLSDCKQIVEWIRVQDEHHAIMHGDILWKNMNQICQKYVEQDKVKGTLLWEAAKSINTVKGDLILLGDIIEFKILPLLQEYMRQYGGIETENEEGDFCFESSESGFLTIKDLENDIYYHSTVDPMWEAKKLAEYIFEPEHAEYSILGCGLGYLIYQLYVISEGSVVINVFEKDERMVEYARNYGVLDWIPKENLNIVVYTDILSFLHSAEKDNMGYYMFVPALRREAGDERIILEELNAEFSTFKKFKRYTDINFWRNIKSDCKLVSEFDTTQLHKDYIIIAAGPSLDESLEFLRENRKKKTLIAVGTVFKKLIENDIIPDMVVVMDPQARTYKQIEGLEEQKVPMLLSILTYWKFAAAYQGERYLVPIAQNENTRNYAIANKVDLWSCGGTVTSLGIEAAIRFGAENIYLVGVDLAYPNGVSHATGTMDRTVRRLDGLVPVEGVGGETVYASRAFNIYRDWIENRIVQTPQITYYNMSRIGARIAGAIEVENS